MRPRSIGCRTCVNRHIRCDLARPTCMRCRVAGRECVGYPPTFILENPGGDTPDTRSSTSETTSSSQRHSQASLAVQIVPKPTSRRYNPTGQNVVPRRFLTGSSPRASPGNFTEDVFCKFFMDQYFSFGTWDPEVQDNRRWIYEILQTPSRSTVALLALRCLVIGFFGRAQRDTALQAQSARIYLTAITALNKGLNSELNDDPRSQHFPSFELIAATLLLLQYEYLAFTATQGWIKHSNGLETLIKLRGPDYFRRHGTRQRALLRWARLPIHVDSLRANTRTFLDLDEWRALWKDGTQAQEESQELQARSNEGTLREGVSETSSIRTTGLMDVVTGLGGIFGDIMKLKEIELGRGDMEDQMSLVGTCYHSLMQMQNNLQKWWELRFGESPSLTAYTLQWTPDTALYVSPESVPSFASLVEAHEVCRYHAYNILILLWLCRLQTLIPADKSTTKPFPTITSTSEYDSASHPDAIRAILHAKAICDVLPVYTLPQYQYIGGLWAAFPGRVAWQTFPRGSKEGLWLEAFLNRVADASGFEVVRNICRSI